MWLLACAKAVLIYYTTSPNANSDVFSSRWIKVFYKNIYIIIIKKKKRQHISVYAQSTV